MPTQPYLGSFGDITNSSLFFRNFIINGNFDIWQRATSQTTSGYGSDDRWVNENVGSAKTASRQTFTVGQTDVPNSPTFFSRTVVTSVAGASNYTVKYQKIENVATLAGQVGVMSFWAKADAAKKMAVEFSQFFGTGGSPSSSVVSFLVWTVNLTTSWQKFTIPVIPPSISGKTLGTNNNSCLQVAFFFEAGSNFNGNTNSLGQQSGTFDIAQVQLEPGSVATPFERRPISLEQQLCQRYYQKVTSWVALVPQGSSGNNAAGSMFVPTPIRTAVSGTHTGVIYVNGISQTYTTRTFAASESGSIDITAFGGPSSYGNSVLGYLTVELNAEL
jgi:hypothetical protein